MPITRLNHAVLYVRDVERSVRFYTDVLGFRPRTDRPDFGFGGAWLDAGPQQVHLIEAPPPPNVGQHFAVQVEDLASVITELRAAGVEVSDASPVGTGLQAFLSDPSGNVVELHQANVG